jgi:hypothetical protein
MLRKVLEMNKGSMLMLSAFAGLALTGGSLARGNTELFTTQDDFTGWGGTPVATPDSDGSAINGLGDTTTTPGGAGAPGSLQLTESSGTFNYIFSQGEQGNTPFLAALGSSGTINFDFQYPVNNGGSYFQLGLVINATGQFGQFFGSAPVNDGDGWYTQSIPYTVSGQPGPFSYFQLGVIFNSNYDTSAPAVFNIDNIQIQSVPEPATMGLVGAGITLLTMRRRRKI